MRISEYSPKISTKECRKINVIQAQLRWQKHVGNREKLINFIVVPSAKLGSECQEAEEKLPLRA